MIVKELLEQIREYEEFQARCDEESRQYQERLTALEQAYREHYDLVESDNANGAAQVGLEKEEAKIAALKDEIKTHQRKARAKLRSMRTKSLLIQEKVVENLHQTLKKKLDVRARLKKELIPKAEENLAALREQSAELKGEISQLRKEARRISHLNLDDWSEE